MRLYMAGHADGRRASTGSVGSSLDAARTHRGIQTVMFMDELEHEDRKLHGLRLHPMRRRGEERDTREILYETERLSRTLTDSDIDEKRFNPTMPRKRVG